MQEGAISAQIPCPLQAMRSKASRVCILNLEDRLGALGRALAVSMQMNLLAERGDRRVEHRGGRVGMAAPSSAGDLADEADHRPFGPP